MNENQDEKKLNEIDQLIQKYNNLESKMDVLIALTSQQSTDKHNANAHENTVSSDKTDNRYEGLEKDVEKRLAENPPDLSTARTDIRRAIDEYCRFVKGFDLNDAFLPDNSTRYMKFQIAGIEQDRIARLCSIYEAGSRGAHGSNVEFMPEQEIQDAVRSIRDDVRILKEWGMDKVDKLNGRILYCHSQDARLLKILDSEEVNNDKFEKKIHWYFNGLDDFIKRYHVDRNQLNIRFNNKDDVKNGDSVNV